MNYFHKPSSASNAYTPEHSTSPISKILAFFVGLYVLFKVLELVGQPVWLWLHSFLDIAWNSFVFLVPAWLIIPRSGSILDDCDDDNAVSSDQKLDNMQAAKSQALRKIFGLDGQGLLKGLQGDGSLRGMSMLLKGSSSDVPPGLGNWDNSCYQNSVIQGLASLPPLDSYLSETSSRYPTLSQDTTNGALHETINKLNNPEHHGQRLWTPAKLKSMSSFQQQDAQEYYSKILDELDKEVLKVSKESAHPTTTGLLEAKVLLESRGEKKEQADDHDAESEPSIEHVKPLQNPLDGLLAQRVGCVECGYTEGLSLIPFNCLTVPLGRNWIYDVRDCLDSYTSLEFIEGVDCAKCTLLRTRDRLVDLLKTAPEAMHPMVNVRLKTVQEALDDDDFADNTLIKKCQVPKKQWVASTKSRQAVVARAPKCLAIHVNRSVFDEFTGSQQKNCAEVRFPRDLDLGAWCLGSQPSKSQDPDAQVEQWTKDPRESILSTTISESSSFQYGLRAAITHYGHHENGHYICYRKHPYTGAENVSTTSDQDEKKDVVAQERWWCLSDDDVSRVTEQNVLNQSGVFMLFYERTDVVAPDLPPDTRITPCLGGEVLPPMDVPVKADDIAESASQVPLLIDDDDEFASLPASPILPSVDPSPTSFQSTFQPNLSLPYPTPPPDDASISAYDTSVYDSEDAPSTQQTSEDECDVAESADKQPLIPSNPGLEVASPMFMRTAGNVSRRSDGGRQSLPMVAAT